ncbi:MAG: FAD-dependent oxidoreductase [Nitrososphaerales archaeon]
MVEEYDVIIIGAGVAGLTAALYASRQKVKTLVISQDLGGQLNLIPRLENYPGFMLTSGDLFARTIENQVTTFGGTVLYDFVQSVEKSEDGFLVKAPNREFACRALVLAVGKLPRELGFDNEKMLVNRGLSYCTKCDAPFYQGRIAATVGVGSYLVESALLLSKMARKVYVIYRTSKMAGDKDLIAALEKRENIEHVPNSEIVELKGTGNLQALVVKDSSGNMRELTVDGLFVEMGSKINVEFVKHLVKTNPKGEIEVNELCETSHAGIFAAGDATNMPYKQVIIAAGEGAKAGISAYNYLQRLAGKPGIRADWKKEIGAQTFHF